MTNEDDIFALLDADAEEAEKAVPKTPNDEFIYWYTELKKPMSKFDVDATYIRSMLTFYDFLTVDGSFNISKNVTIYGAPKIKTLDRKGYARELIKFCIVCVHAHNWQTMWGKNGNKPIDIEVCLDRIMLTNLANTISYQSTNKLRAP